MSTNKVLSIVLFLLLLLPSISFRAQTINITLPEEANNDYFFILNKGLKQDTIQKGTMGFAGNATIKIPQKYRGYRGIGALQIKDKTTFVHLVVNNENFTAGRGANNKFKFLNSKENDYLYSIIQDRKTPGANPSLYASSFVEITRFIQRQNKALAQGATLKEKADVRQYARNSLNMEDLYTSGLWFFTIDNIVKLSANEQILGEDMVKILGRIQSQEVFEALTNDLITITEQFGLDDAFDIIVPYIQQTGRIKVPQGKVFDAFTMAKLRKGMTAPAITGYKRQQNIPQVNKTIVIFYDPDCHNCEIQLEQLIKEYNKLLQYGIQVVSVSSSFEKDEHEKDVKRFPWSNSLCDFKGFLGNNFKKFGVISTPTVFLLNGENKILGRYAVISKMNLYDQNR